MVWFRKSVAVDSAAVAAAYAATLAAARRPEFFRGMGVADTLDGRFDLLCVHAVLALRRLRRIDSGESRALAQALFDAMFADMDAALERQDDADVLSGALRFPAPFLDEDSHREA